MALVQYVEARTDKGYRVRIREDDIRMIIEDEVKGSPIPKVVLANGQAIALQGDNMDTLFSKIAQARGGEGMATIVDKPSPEALATLPGTSADVVRVAKVCHEVNRAYCESLGDISQSIWNVAPKWQKDAAIAGVLFHIQNPAAGPEASHEAWMAKRIENGWAYGEAFSEQDKTHPCMVPFAELPPEQQFKDVLFRAIVHASF
jgi:hypothetical protein